LSTIIRSLSTLKFDELREGNRMKHGQNFEEVTRQRLGVIYSCEKMEIEDDCPSIDLITRLISESKKGIYLAWLAITGAYPSVSELSKFRSEISIYGGLIAVKRLRLQRGKSSVHLKVMESCKLLQPQAQNIFDVTHTSTAPFLTGIQRVVSKIAEATPHSEIVMLKASGIEGVFQPLELSFQTSEMIGLATHQTWHTKTISASHRISLRLQKRKFSRSLNRTLLPPARKIKQKVIQLETKAVFKSIDFDDFFNLYLPGSNLVIPEIPSNLEQISIYRCLFENKIVKSQMILYDFIPFFHAWTVHPGNRGHYNSYVCLMFCVDRVVAISELVAEQSKLILKAYFLEKPNHSSSIPLVNWLNLPSGIKPASQSEFAKVQGRIVMLGSLEPRKNHLQFFDALEILHRDSLKFEAFILGSAGWENNHLVERIEKMQSEGIDLVRITDITDDSIREIVGSSQVLVQISEAEGYGLPVVEALALGTKVIVSNIRPLVDIGNEDVSVVELGNAQQLAESLKSHLKNSPEGFAPYPDSVQWSDWSRLLFKEFN
jgi:glycosyltransferase involved in cell wall biosynthesis